MWGDFRQSFAIAILGAAALAPLRVQAADEQFGAVPQQGVLLLRNGEALEGKISRVGDFYVVAFDNGKLRVRATDVEVCCRDIEEGYRRKRAAIRVGNVNDHLRLAHWCERHGLLGPCAQELADAFDADPTHPMIAVLERRLRAAMAPPEESRPPAKTPDPAPSPDDLDRLVRGMPAGTVETFTRTIQPLLLNTCTSGGCHTQHSAFSIQHSAFRLLRIPAHQPPSRLLTQRNLHATLQWIDRKEPGASKLLTAALRPHGTAATASFTDPQAIQYRRLAEWVQQVAKGPAPQAPPLVVPATVGSQQRPAVQAMPAESARSTSARPGASRPEGQQAATAPPASRAVRLSPRPAVQRGAPLSGFVPVDPFDPEIFNRRFFPRNGTEGSEVGGTHQAG